MRHFLTIALVVLMAVGCTEKQDEGTDGAIMRSMVFRITGAECDQFHIYDGVQWQPFAEDRSIADDAYCGLAYESAKFYCVHPFADTFEFIDGKVKVTIPQYQSCSEGGLDNQAYFYGGMSCRNSIEMQSLCGVVEFTLADEGINRVRLSGKENERIAGRHSVIFNDDNTVGFAPALGVDDWTTVILTPNDSTAFKAGKWSIVIYPRAFTKGVSLEFASVDGKTEKLDFPAFELLGGATHYIGEILLGWNKEPDTPDTPVEPDEPDEPDTPDTPDEPDTPVEPDEPDTPDEPDDTDKAGGSVENYKNGDEYQWKN